MKRPAQLVLGFTVSAYAIGVAVSMVIYALQHRHDCYARDGVVGIFWCDVPSTAGWMVVTAKSLVWPYYLYELLT
jgi:hypothetical protein